MLDGKERERDDQGDGDHGDGEVRVDERQALDGREDRNRRRDHGVAVEQRGCEQRGHRNGRQQARAGRHPADQGKQREGAALASVVGAHGDQHVLHGDHQDQCPEDQGEHAHHVQRRRGRPAQGAGSDWQSKRGSLPRSRSLSQLSSSDHQQRTIALHKRDGAMRRSQSCCFSAAELDGAAALTASYCLHISVPFPAG